MLENRPGCHCGERAGDRPRRENNGVDEISEQSPPETGVRQPRLEDGATGERRWLDQGQVFRPNLVRPRKRRNMSFVPSPVPGRGMIGLWTHLENSGRRRRPVIRARTCDGCPAISRMAHYLDPKFPAT